MNKKKFLIVTLGLGAIGTALYFIFKEDADKMLAGLMGKPIDSGKVSAGYIPSTSGSYEQNDILQDKPAVNLDKPNSGQDAVEGFTQISKGYVGCPNYKQDSFPLARGMKGGYVVSLQTSLNKVYNARLTADGCFGPGTESAVKKYLGRNTVSQDNYKKLFQAYHGIINISQLKYT
jgi:hypothetical protein